VENPNLASKYAVNKTPTYLLFKKGIHVDTVVGVTTIAEIERNLRKIAVRI